MNVNSKLPGAGGLRLRAPSSISRLGLRWKVVLAAVSFALIPVLVLGFFLNVRSNAAIEDEALRGLEDEARALQAALNETINSHAADAVLLAKSDTLYFQSASTQQRREILTNHADVWDYASDISVVSNQGDVIFSLDADTAYPSQADRLYFQQASQLSEGRVFVGDIGTDEMSGEPVISIAAPAYNEFGTLLGVIRIAWPVSELNSFVSDLGRAEDLRISILQGNGTVVASSSGAAFGESREGLTAVQEGLRGQAGTLRESVGGEGDAFIAFAPVQESSAISGLGWAITVDAPADQVLAPVVSNRNWTIALVLIVALLAIVAAVLFAHRLVAPIQRLAVAARAVAGGNYGARVPVAARDEVGTTALAFNQMLDEITGLIQTREDRDRIQTQIIQLLTEVNAVAEGDLTIEAEVTGDELGSVADSFNFMIAELRKIITNVNETTTAVSFASVEIVQSSSELAVSSEHQSEQISGAATAIEEMAVSIQQVSQNADLSSEVAREAQANAQAGAEAVQATIEAMNRIRQQVEEAQRTIARLGESSQEIGSIVQVISQIARQTNTLALNASIQAARAGEHGRGFAVVADEVRRLAERSSNATKQISGLISSIQSETAEAVVAMDQSTQEVAEGSNLADGAGTALAQIDAVVSRLGELIEAISHAAQQQAGTAGEISRTMQDINAVTQTTTLGTRQAAESVNSLSSLAERLRESVAMFRLSSEQEQSMAGSVADGD